MKRTKDILVTALFMGVLVLITAIGFFTYKIVNAWDDVYFTMSHPEMVKGIREQFASESAQLEKKFVTREKTTEEKLQEAVAEELKR